jgi:LPPG:FO 2-phospho-L-lactate transferase
VTAESGTGSGRVVVLAGGTGGAKLAAGMQQLVGERLTVIANTGDDIEVHGGHVSPDPDLCLYWLADRIDERGWGLRDDSFVVMEMLAELGEDVWFRLGDRDLAVCLQRARRLAAGDTLTDAIAQLRRELGVAAHVLPMCDEPVRTEVCLDHGWVGFQEFMIHLRAARPVRDVAFRGAEAATLSAAVRSALQEAETIVVGPSNPVVSIGPILALPGLRDAMRVAPAPIVAVSPLVGGAVVKGPTEPFMAWAGKPLSSDGVVSAYDGLLDGLVADERASSLPTLETDVLMSDAAARARVAAETLDFARSLAGRGGR